MLLVLLLLADLVGSILLSLKGASVRLMLIISLDFVVVVSLLQLLMELLDIWWCDDSDEAMEADNSFNDEIVHLVCVVSFEENM